MTTLHVGESVRWGWNTFKKRPWILIGGVLIAMVISSVASSLLEPGEVNSAVAVILVVANALIGILVEIGLITFALRAHDRIEEVSIRDLWNPKPLWPYIVAQIVVGIAVLAGLILLIVPGIIVALMFLFTSYLIIDKGRGPIEAMKQSMHITKGHRMQLFLLLLALIGINILGLLALVVGLLVTVPVSMLTIAHAYRTLEKAAPAVA